ncbi:uncharacterized protein LOC123397697 [Hordeum vulgare subsp. vulgare]|uniref:uncharacterized protein LOC123397697 n=1 Tax=Hordeum vulgare subsp. vulgare TaxID=112509 RepID=UPI001D1A455E|nr:uncharacterized protein LOC123397697 [Hordeum vulgare subsp. vulgare]
MVNPPELMAPYTSQPVAVPENCRSMFITFSKENALHREEIFQYFRQSSCCILQSPVNWPQLTFGVTDMMMMDSSKRKSGEAATITADQVCPSNNNKRNKALLLSLCTLLFSDEMMLEVLLRLPVKSILCFWSVCRAWAVILFSKD